jgi:hypothetical protein
MNQRDGWMNSVSLHMHPTNFSLIADKVYYNKSDIVLFVELVTIYKKWKTQIKRQHPSLKKNLR